MLKRAFDASLACVGLLVSAPLGALFATLILVVFIGEAVREAFDPKVHSRLR